MAVLSFVAPHSLHVRPLVIGRGSDLVVRNASPEAGATTPAASPASTTSRPLSKRLSGFRGMGAPSRRIVDVSARPVSLRRPADGQSNSVTLQIARLALPPVSSSSDMPTSWIPNWRATSNGGRHLSAEKPVCSRPLLPNPSYMDSPQSATMN